ncbi:MAG TPA: ROK family protein [Acidimicrobiales bacterium]|nr:ROK family protein [Acidimicrobiales bacterium]
MSGSLSVREGNVVALDIGGTKMAVGVVSGSGKVLWNARSPTPPGGDAGGVWDTLASLLESVPGAFAPVACGVGSGGPMSPGGEQVSPLNIPGWRDFPLRRRVAELTGLPTWVDNDAKALALAEGWIGGAAGERDFIAMVVSTGIGGGIVLDGRLLDGATGNAGHIGHVVVEPDGRRCECGGRGCLEAEASGTAIAAVTGRPPSQAPTEVVDRTGRLVGRGVACVANLLDLRLAIVSGSVALGFGEPFFEAAQREIDARARIAFSRGCLIVPSKLGTEGPLIGAAAVAWRSLEGEG